MLLSENNIVVGFVAYERKSNFKSDNLRLNERVIELKNF